MCNAFVFDGGHGVNLYIRKLKEILICQLWMLEHVEIVSSCRYSTFFMALGNVPLPMYGGQHIVMVGFYAQLI